VISFTWTFLIQIINIIVLFLILRKLLYKPVTDLLEKRKEDIKNNISEAERQRAEAMELKAKYEEYISRMKEEAEEIIRNASKKGEERKEEIIKEAKEEAERIIARARLEITREKEKALAELKEEVVNLAIMSATKVIEKNLDEAKHRELIKNFINEVGEAKWQS